MLPRGTWRERGQARQCPLCPVSWSHTATDCTHVKPSRESILRIYHATHSRTTLCLGRSALFWEASTTQGLLLWEQEGTCQHPPLWSQLPRNTGMHTSRMHHRTQFPGFLARGDFSTAPGSTAIVPPRKARIRGPTFSYLLASPMQARIPRSQRPRRVESEQGSAQKP